MPELPEVETVRRGLEMTLAGRKIIRSEVFRTGLRIPFPPNLEEVLSGYEISSISRRGKYLVFDSSNKTERLVIHLGMSGRILLVRADSWEQPGKHDHFVMESDHGWLMILNDPRRFGALFLAEDPDGHPSLAALGPEPLGDSFDGKELARRLKRTRRPLKNALLDQSIVAGMGNIYACEALFDASLSPFMEASKITEKESERLVNAIRKVLLRAIDAGGSTLRDYAQPNGESGYFQHSFSVYGKEGERCPGCTCDPARTGGIHRTSQSGRSTFFCPVKQCGKK